jgi:hypothetical protein
MASIEVAVFNKSAAVSDADVKNMATAVQAQNAEDFNPIWGVDAQIAFYASGAVIPRAAWQIGVFDNSDQAGALGYHDLTTEGLPLGKVFAASALSSGQQVSVTLSHEALEMLADPDINLTAFVEDSKGVGRLYAYEVCDAVEAFGYDKGGVRVSDFVTPAWFESFRKPKSTLFSFKGNVEAPFTLAAGGYIGYYDITSGSGWQQLTARGISYLRARPQRGSRRERRRTPREQWMLSSLTP